MEDQINFDSRDDATVANLCLRKALAFKQEFENKDADENSKMQIAVLDYAFIPFHEQFCEEIHFNTRTAK